MPGKFRFCLRCGDSTASPGTDITRSRRSRPKAAARRRPCSSSSALRWMHGESGAGRRHSASCSASPTTARTPRCRPATSTISSSSLCCAARSSPRSSGGARGLGRRDSGVALQQRAWLRSASAREYCARFAPRAGCSSPTSGQARRRGRARCCARVLAYRVWFDQTARLALHEPEPRAARASCASSISARRAGQR